MQDTAKGAPGAKAPLWSAQDIFLIRVFQRGRFFRFRQPNDYLFHLRDTRHWRLLFFWLTGPDFFNNAIYQVFHRTGVRYIFHNEIAANQVNVDGSVAQEKAPGSIQVHTNLLHIIKRC